MALRIESQLFDEMLLRIKCKWSLVLDKMVVGEYYLIVSGVCGPLVGFGWMLVREK